MPWTELLALRNQRSRTYQDDASPLQQAWSGTPAALHYESELDSGIYNTQVDMTPVRVDNPQFDGWRITANGWHHALGKDLANHGDQDGWVGFGGRQGAHWFKFQLLRVGYLHWPTRAWDDIGAAPNYDRTNLSQQTGTLTIGPNNDQIPTQTVATWSNIWATPGGGDLAIRWSANADRLKEEIVINQAGREWIATNRPPATPLNETWFGFVFRLDWSDIPRVYRQSILQDTDGDFADDGEHIELRDAVDRLLAFMPLSTVQVPTDGSAAEEANPPIRLRKRFWKGPDDNCYLLVGVRCDILNGITAGDLIFDPTVDVQVGASADDGYCKPTKPGFSAGGSCYIGDDGGNPVHAFFRWTGVTISDTIDVAYVEVYRNNGGTDILMKWRGVDEDNPAAPTGTAEFSADPLTTAGVDWDIDFDNAQWYQSPSLVAIFQELVDSYTIDNDAVMLQLRDDGTTSDSENSTKSWDNDTSLAAKLHIEYTVTARIPRYGFTNFQVPGIV